ncbi:hypothetical protein HPB51_016124 [Rhipicephalus microplus]|uniref:Transposase Tc1-like domain-containing protein n=1 Tax=Rhipicephalus microplus TaxID=6941 RepID=A0A9J6DW64_RHIMP|nr:hypothetical protein HPB51_016124 [Rhipicephalus microplus]
MMHETYSQLRRIDSHVVLEAFLLLDALPIPRTYSTANDFTHLALYAEVGGTCGETAPAGPDDVALAGSTFPLVEDLEVLTRSVEALDKIAAFQHVDTLLVALAPPVAWANVDSKLQQLLGNWPRLGKLALEYCGGVRLSTIAALCPKVRSLRLAYCKWDPSDCPVEAGAFPELESIELYIRMADAVFDSLFLATCGRLRKVQLYNDRSCCQFLHLCVRKRAHFPCLEELRLSTDISVRAMALEPESLHNVLRALPALRHLATDSYDLKLFFENYYVPRGRVFYSRDACVFCAVHGTNVPSRLQAASAVASNLIGHSATTDDEDALRSVAAAVRNPFLPAPAIREDLDFDVSDTTVRRRLHTAGLRSRVAAQKPLLTAAHKGARREFAEFHEAWTPEEWSRVIFLDESTFST